MSYIYEVGPINYFNLSRPEQGAVLAGFAAALQQLSSAVTFHVKLDRMSVVVGNELYEVKYRRYFVEDEQPPLQCHQDFGRKLPTLVTVS